MKQIFVRLLLALLLVLSPVLTSYAANITVKMNEDGKWAYFVDGVEVKAVSRYDFFDAMWGDIEAPKSYKYIKLNYSDIGVGSNEYDFLQKLVYFDIIDNSKPYSLNLDKNISRKHAKKFLENYYLMRFKTFNNLDITSPLTNYDIRLIKEELQKSQYDDYDLGETSEIERKFQIMYDVYDTINNNHVNKDSLDKEEILNSAIKGLTEGTGDKYTTYFPPVENEDFQDQIDGSFEGIGAYVSMQKPGVFMIEGIIDGAPSQKAGLQAGDRVLKVDGKDITAEDTADEVISWIKGPKGSKVLLLILRGEEEFEVELTRDTVKINEIESEILEGDTYYLRISMFNTGISGEFKDRLYEIRDNKNIKKIIIDVRSNPGGLLSEVSSMLDYIVPKGEPKIVVKGPGRDEIQSSKGKQVIDFNDYEVIMLIDHSSASASEILAGTMRDYLEDMVIIGEKSYGKGSVQTIKEYIDGSSLKYTVAKWYTGGSETGIDGIGIVPDFEVELDIEAYKLDGSDNQLKRALKH